MIDDKSMLAIIPARGGSKGVPRKNIRQLAGKPLIAWSIEAAKQSKYIDRLILSSEDEEIIAVAKAWGCEAPFVRPAELAGDDVPGIEPVLHALNTLPGKYDYVVLMQPTSPLRTVQDIDGCIEHCVRRAANACVSVTEPDKSLYWAYVLDAEGRMQPLLDTGELIFQRQDLPKTYVLNGAVYVADCEWLLKTKTFITAETLAYPMDKVNSVDIDSELDLKFAEMLLPRP
jgi:N-acylneuraminate cytidylyltransferase